ncbi:hypothetical protein HMPREF1092_00352 [Clostridium thermobutyricum]|uniref:Glycosyl transferase family 1 domain-containing protein n=1 Tax=Clostridium thermobutyricum TaxID=29372 RepID=N9WJ95_9CLOT|nr:glycosyltransferase [Clostridium thermobutyricum]ENZ03166.1 hypothetical protein HMPREF1092_00352 [Clostridium thermobutyricum]
MKKEEIYDICNGIDEHKFSNKYVNLEEKIERRKSILCELGLEDKFNILQGSSINKRRGTDILLKACKRLKDQNKDFNLILLGYGDEIWLRENIKELNMENNIKKFKFQDPKKFYEIADIVTLASRKEGFVLVVIEAMVMEIPVIRSNTEEAFDQIKHSLDGYIFESENN